MYLLRYLKSTDKAKSFNLEEFFLMKLSIVFSSENQGLLLYKIFDTNALYIFLTKTTNVTKKKIF